MPEQAEIFATTCINYTGQPICSAGVVIADLTRRFARKPASAPCVGCHNVDGTKCALYTPPSPDVVAGKLEAIAQRVSAILRIKHDAGGFRGITGTVECAKCYQTMKYSVDAYGIITGQCVNAGCLKVST